MTTYIGQIIKTVIATFIGGYITLHSFRKQERYKVRESLKIDVYRKYNIDFDKILEKINNFEKCYLYINSNCDDLLLDENYTGGSIDFKLSTNTLCVEDIIEVKDLLKRLINYIDRELDILEYDINPYKDIHNRFCEFEDRVKGVIFYEFTINSYIQNQITPPILEYNECIRDVSNMYNDFEKVQHDMKSIHGKIKKDIFGRYFKTKKWKLKTTSK